MGWRPSRAVLCTMTPLCLLVSGKAYNLPGLLTGCSRTVGMMLPPMEKWVSQMVPWTREILWLFCGMAFISAHVKKSWKGGHSAYHHMNSIMGRTLHLPPHELNHGEDTPPTTTWTQSWGGNSTYHHMNSIMGRTLHLPSHELNHGGHSYHHMNSIMGRTLHLWHHELSHGEDTSPTITWTQTWGEYSTYHHMNSIMGVTPPTITWTQSWGVHSTYNNINSITGRTLHLPPHELSHGEDTPPTTTWTQWWGGHFTYNHMNSMMGRTLRLPPHELNHGEDTPPTTTWT